MQIVRILPTAEVHNPPRFHENRLKNFCIILLIDKHAGAGENITSLVEVTMIQLLFVTTSPVFVYLVSIPWSPQAVSLGKPLGISEMTFLQTSFPSSCHTTTS